jgi:hypothetical protein
MQNLFLAWTAATAICFPSMGREHVLAARSGAHATTFELPPQSNSLETQRAAVVKLRVQRPGKSEETAAGLFVGKDAKYAYFITALHAVKVDPDPKSQDLVLLHSVRLQFYTSPQTFEALVLASCDPSLDLGVVYIPIGNLPSGLPQLGIKDAALGVPVHVIGNPSAGDWSVASGTVENENASSGDIHHFIITRDKSLAEGHSGGPVLDDQGNFLGMHTETNPTYGIEAKSGEIVAQLKAWHVPTDNLAAPVPPGSAAAPSTASAEAEIDKVLNAYEAAYSRMDAGALWRIWPSASADRRRAIQTTFDLARSVTLKITDRQIEFAPDGMSAIVTAQCTKDVVPNQGSAPPRLNVTTTFKLERQKSTWVLISVI